MSSRSSGWRAQVSRPGRRSNRVWGDGLRVLDGRRGHFCTVTGRRLPAGQRAWSVERFIRLGDRAGPAAPGSAAHPSPSRRPVLARSGGDLLTSGV